VTHVEAVLRSGDADDDVWLHTTLLAIGEVIQAGAGSWRVVAEESPTHIGAELARVARRLAELNA